jgi:hypothetical protein
VTLLMVAAEPEAVITVADSLAYTSLGHTSWTSKVQLLPQHEALIAAHGVSGMGEFYALTVRSDGRRFVSLDDVLAETPEMLRECWKLLRLDTEPDALTVVYVAGYSPHHGRHIAVRFSSTDEFEPTLRTEGVNIFPPPVDPSAVTYPETLEDWVALAEHIRNEQIALEAGDGSRGRVLIGGRLIHTVLQGGIALQQTIHQFDDSPDAWAHYQRDMANPARRPPFPDIPAPQGETP